MVYRYRYAYMFFMAAVVLSLSFSFVRLDVLCAVLSNDRLTTVSLLLAVMQVFAVPIFFLFIGFVFRRICIETNDDGVKYISPFREILIKWKDIRYVTRIGRWVKISSGDESFVFHISICVNSSFFNKNTSVLVSGCPIIKKIKNKAPSVNMHIL